jgi:hypothetical protein
MRLACLLAVWLSVVACAQTASHDWTGYYMQARGRDAAGLKIVSPNFQKTVADHLQPWAKLKMEETNGIADDTGAVCLPAGILRVASMPYSGNFLYLPHGDKITLVYFQNASSRVRRIYLNQQHPRNLRPSWNGHSIGHWENDTLVVDTIGFNDKSWLSADMAPHTEETHLTERLRQIENNGNTYIEFAGVVEDRHALTSAYTFTRYYRKEKREMPISICADEIQMWKDWRNDELKQQYQHAREVK